MEEYRRQSGISNIRTFIAMPVVGAPVEAIGSLVDDLKRAGVRAKWVEPHNMHLTIKFLGDLPRAHIGRLADAVSRAAQGETEFEVELAGAGAFPNMRSPRVLWVGARGGVERMGRLARLVEEHTVAAGFAPADKAFSPHLTIGRTRGECVGAQAMEIISRDSGVLWGMVAVRGIHVVASTLSGSGPVYTSLARIPLLEAGQGRQGRTCVRRSDQFER